MAPSSHRRQVLLFLVAVLLPCAALLALGVRLVVQERELAASRLQDDRRRIARELGQELASRLERIALRQVTALSSEPGLLHRRRYADSTVVLVARISETRLVLPWEQDERAAESRSLRMQGEFGLRLRQGEEAEFGVGDIQSAVTRYRQASELANHPVQRAHARLFLARVLAKARRRAEATALYEQLATAPPEVVDENGLPMALYAARQLLELGQVGDTEADVLEASRSVLASDRWLSPTVMYLLRDLMAGVLEESSDAPTRGDAQALSEDLARRLAQVKQALALKAELPGLGILASGRMSVSVDTRWISFGEPSWFVGSPPVGDGEDGLVVAILSAPVLESLEAENNRSATDVGEASVTDRAEEGDALLGVAFPGLFAHFGPPSRGLNGHLAGIQRWFYLAGLLLVLGVTLFSAYLLWRDVRREVELAETRSRFVAAVSHELKTPLTAIRMFAETLHEGGAVNPEAEDEYLETIVNESERLTRLLNNVLDFSKIESGKKTYRRELQSLAEIVRFTARAMRYPLEQKRFSLQVEIRGDVPPVPVDRDAIEQAILNLLANAMKYSGKSREIELGLRSEGSAAVIEVSDHGVGIEPTEVSRIFERFYRTSSPENDRVPGAGLGLTLVQHIAEAHGGRVAVRSEPGVGSTFSLFLPLSGAEA